MRYHKGPSLASFLLTAFLISCGGNPPAVPWKDLFEVQPPVRLTDAAVGLLEADSIFDPTEPTWVGRLRVDDGIPPRGDGILSQVRASALRNGELRGPGSSSVILPRFVQLAAAGRELGLSLIRFPTVVGETPYWTAAFSIIGAQTGGDVYVALNLQYPIFRYNSDGMLVDSFGIPPDSWRQARKPEPGEFSPGREPTFSDYLQTFTTITGLAALADSVLIVNHGVFELQPGNVLRVVPKSLDVYVRGHRIAMDVASPGEIFGYSKSSVFFLTGGPPTSDWEVTEYVWLNGNGSTTGSH